MTAFAQIAPGPHRFTFEEARVMFDTGAFGDRRIELLDGEIIDVPSEGITHLFLRSELHSHFARVLDRAAWLVVGNGTMQLSVFDAPEPDVFIVDRSRFAFPVDPSSVPLLIEVSVTSLDQDLSRKNRKYASYGFAEYWVVDEAGRETIVLTQPRADGYASRVPVPFDALLTPVGLPQAAVRITDLGPF